MLYEFHKIIGDDNGSISKSKGIGANKAAMPEFYREGKVFLLGIYKYILYNPLNIIIVIDCSKYWI